MNKKRLACLTLSVIVAGFVSVVSYCSFNRIGSYDDWVNRNSALATPHPVIPRSARATSPMVPASIHSCVYQPRHSTLTLAESSISGSDRRRTATRLRYSSTTVLLPSSLAVSISLGRFLATLTLA